MSAGDVVSTWDAKFGRALEGAVDASGEVEDVLDDVGGGVIVDWTPVV